MLAVYLPDTFAQLGAQPVGASFDGGEQMFVTGHSGNLQFEFGQSPVATSYSGSGWFSRDVDSLITGSIEQPIGRPAIYQSASTPGGAVDQQHVVYRTNGNDIIEVTSTETSWSWQSNGGNNDVHSDPSAYSLHGGRQILYVNHQGYVRMVSRVGNAMGFNNVLHSIVGQTGDPNALAVPESGVVGFELGAQEYFVYQRVDGGLGVFRLSGGTWTYDVWNGSDFAGYAAPAAGGSGSLESVFYTTQNGTNVGWILYQDTSGRLRGVWITSSAGPFSAVLANVPMLGAPSAAFDPLQHKLSVAMYDANAHVHLLQEGPTGWSDRDYHASSVLEMPLADYYSSAESDPIPASAVVTLNDTSTISVTSAIPGTIHNFYTVSFIDDNAVIPGQATVFYNEPNGTIVVHVNGDTAKGVIATAIDGLPNFHASAGGAGVGFVQANDSAVTATLAGGLAPFGNDITPRPDLYWRAHSVGPAGPGLHILYKDQSQHVHNVRVTSDPGRFALDTTAFLEGYRDDFSYGMVNAARAVAYALNTSTALSGGSPASWNLDVMKVPSAWQQATGSNVAVFALDSGVDTTNLDLQTLSGRDIVAGNSTVTDTNGHGTSVAGIIAAANNAGGATGVAYDARVVPVKIGDGFVDSETAIVDAIDHAMGYTLPPGYVSSPRVINMSFASAVSGTAEATLPNLRYKLYENLPSAVFVMAAGNRGQAEPEYPAAFGVGFGIVAGALTESVRRWSANNGTSATTHIYNYLLAPGVGAPASALVGSSGDPFNSANATGSSAAAAHISGVVALMLDANPALTAREIESILIASTDAVTQTFTVLPPSPPAMIYWTQAVFSCAVLDSPFDLPELPAETPKPWNESPVVFLPVQPMAVIAPSQNLVTHDAALMNSEGQETLDALFAADWMGERAGEFALSGLLNQ